MKGISLLNPFANLVGMGYKTIETRVGASSLAKTKYRGNVLICTSKGKHPFWKDCITHYRLEGESQMDPYFKKACDIVWKESGKNWVEFTGLMMVPINKSHAIAVARLVDVVDMKPEHQDAACCEIYPTAKAMMLEDIHMIVPFDITGLTNGFHLGVFDVNLKTTVQYL